jgi:hypothetical protein
MTASAVVAPDRIAAAVQLADRRHIAISVIVGILAEKRAAPRVQAFMPSVVAFGCNNYRRGAFGKRPLKGFTVMKRIILPLLAVSGLLAGCSTYDDNGPRYGHNDYGNDGGWDAHEHYRDDSSYQERRMSSDEQVYRGSDGRYYCRRSDGTAGLIVGGVAGGALGDAIAPRGSKTLGTLLGAIGGAAVGSSVDKGDTRCR